MRIITDKGKYFHQALAIVSSFKPYNRLTPKELQVLGELMKHKHDGYKPLLNTEVRRLVEKDIGISSNVFRNILTRLRAEGLLVDDNIPEKYLIKYLTPFTFEFYEES